MLDPGAYQRALQARQGPQQVVPGTVFHQSPQEIVPGLTFSQDRPPMQNPPMQQQQQDQPDLLELLMMILGQ